MRILLTQTFPLWGGGSGTYTRCLAEELAKNNEHKVAILSQERKKLPKIASYNLDFPFPVVFQCHPAFPGARKFKDLAPKDIEKVYQMFLESTTEAVEDFRPDVIHSQHLSILTWAANVISCLYNINFVVTAHGTGVEAAKDNNLYIPLSQDALTRAKKIICNSGYTRKNLLKTFGRGFKRKTRILPGGINLEKYPEQTRIRIINKKYNLENRKVILFTGRLTKEKGVDYLVRASNKINGQIYIIGDGPQLNELKILAEKLKRHNVHFLGFLGNEQANELKEFYYRADVFTAPSVWHEPLGLTILEAMAASTPVVATKKGGISLAVKDGKTGILVKARTTNKLAEAINSLLLDNKKREKMGQEARKLVEEKFTWSYITKQIEQFYQEAENHKKQ